ncbi:PRC-barrel domain-containing protein [Granulosicoccus sp. 3-233]|uniref:PRC-barrel domain-containing protein n=1 Tax=Granulosicoccus sp. 3-233 TaxID=3417969 RepID=UPI003D3300AA
MMYRHLVLASLLVASGVVQAQATRWIEIEDGAMMIPGFNLTVDELDGMDLYDSTGEKVGEVDDVLIGEDGTSMAASLDIGGFLGIGEKDVVVPLESLTVSEEGLVTSMDREGLESLPEFDD